MKCCIHVKLFIFGSVPSGLPSQTPSIIPREYRIWLMTCEAIGSRLNQLLLAHSPQKKLRPHKVQKDWQTPPASPSSRP